jgi:non-ribosomal peptide synthetase component F
VLCRWSGQEDVVIGTAVPGRRSAQLEQLVGCLINMVVLRTDLSGDPTFAELVARTMATVSGAWDTSAATWRSRASASPRTSGRGSPGP